MWPAAKKPGRFQEGFCGLIFCNGNLWLCILCSASPDVCISDFAVSWHVRIVLLCEFKDFRTILLQSGCSQNKQIADSGCHLL